jgi:hypothetical protein
MYARALMRHGSFDLSNRPDDPEILAYPGNRPVN